MIGRVSTALSRAATRLHHYFQRGPLRRFLQTAVNNLIEHNATQLASAMAFDLFLALVPLLALLGWAVSRVLQGNASLVQSLSLWLDVTPEAVRELVEQHAERFSGTTLAPLALLGALWLASGAFDTVMAAFERSVPSHARPWWLRRLLAIACVVFLLLSISAGAWLSVHLSGGPELLLNWVPEAQRAEDSWLVLDAPRAIGVLVSLTTLTLIVAGFFRIGVHREGKRRVVWPGTFVTLLIATAVSSAFALYARTLARYAFYYGSLAAVAVILAWLWLCSFALLCGAEVNIHLEENPSFIRDSLRPLLRKRGRSTGKPG